MMSESCQSDDWSFTMRDASRASLIVAMFELAYESVSIDVGEWILPPVRVVVDRGKGTARSRAK